MLTPEEQAALDHLRDGGISVTNDGGKSWCDSLQTMQAKEIAIAIALREHPADEQPVDWPTELGLWWMNSPRFSRDELVEFCEDNFSCIEFRGGRFVRATVRQWDARFLPAHIPTFPPRENHDAQD